MPRSRPTTTARATTAASAQAGTRRRRRGAFARADVRRADGLGEVSPEALQLLDEVSGRGVALFRVLREASLDDPAEGRRELRIELRHRLGLVADDGGQRLGDRGPGEGAFPGEHLVQDDAERELVAPEIDGLAPRLLRRHVGHRPEDDPLLAHGRERGRPGVGRLVVRDVVPGEAEVEELGVPVLRQEDVLGLDVAVDDPFPVRRREAFRHLQARRRGPCGAASVPGPAGSRSVSPSRSSVTANWTPPNSPDVEEREDVRVRERGDGARLALEAGQRAWIVRNVLGRTLTATSRPSRVSRAR